MFRVAFRCTLAALSLCAAATAHGQTLDKGDIALLAINSNIGDCVAGPDATDGYDEISFVCFKTILPGFTIDLTDNGYSRCNVGQWGDTEGAVRLTKGTGSITAGVVITVRLTSASGAGNVVFVNPPGGWTCAYSPGFTGGNVNLNSGGDQLFFLQGGTWTNPAGAHDADYTGVNAKVISAFTTNLVWNPTCASPAGNQNSALPPGIDCFASAPTSVTDFTKYSGPTFSVTQRDWLIRIDTPGNWTSYASCAAFNAGGTNYSAVGASIPFLAGGFTPGDWKGTYGTNWFDCRNWGDNEVPTSTTPVRIGGFVGSINHCTVQTGGTAYAQSVDVISAGTSYYLSVLNSSVLQVTGNARIQADNGILSPARITIGDAVNPGTLTIGGNLLLTGTAPMAQQAIFTSTHAANYVSTGGNLTINSTGQLDLSAGVTGSTFYLGGNYANNANIAAFDDAGSTMTFNGSGTQSITTSGFTEDFAAFTLNKPAGDLFLNSPIVVRTYLTLTAGRLMTSNTNLLTLANTSGTFAPNDPSFVHGPMVKVGTMAYQFPIGKGIFKHPVASSFVNAGSINDAFIAEYFPADPNVDIGTPIESPPLDHISTCEYWRLDQYIGTPTCKVNLQWDPTTVCGISSLPDLRIAHWDGTMWRERSNQPNMGSTLMIGSITTSAPQETSFSPGGYWTLASTSEENPLPIELLYFNARPTGKDVLVDWATATELNNDHFTVERSADGVEFTEVVRVPGAGNSPSMNTYAEYDRDPLPGLSYYRLRQTDYDGTSTLSQVVPVRFDDGSSDLAVLYGNDAVLALHSFPVGSTMEVLDMTGRVISRRTVGTEALEQVPVNGLPPGAYVLRMSLGERVESTRFLH